MELESMARSDGGEGRLAEVERAGGEGRSRFDAPIVHKVERAELSEVSRGMQLPYTETTYHSDSVADRGLIRGSYRCREELPEGSYTAMLRGRGGML